MTSIRVAGYELFERLGEGGAGQVYRAQDASGKSLAVKLLGPAAELDPEAARARFAREVKILSQLDHPALATLVDHGVDDELGPYLVMPLVPGQTLRAIIAGAKLCPEAAVLLIEPIASAVAALHARELVHRDLKPDNVMVAPDGRVIVVDLGLAWGPHHTRHTQEGTAIGSVPYMAPEQIEGAGVGTAADVWALGVILYELIAGKRPFARPRASEEAAAVLVGAYAPLDAVDPRCPPELVRLVAQALDRAPGARPSAQDFVAQLAIDWIEPGDRARDRAAIALAPADYVQRVAPFRVRREKRLAREAIAAARPFQALAHVDRALAYAPNDPELLSLAAEAEAKSSQAPADHSDVVRSVEAAVPVEVRERRPWRVAAAAAVGAAAATIATWFAVRPHAEPIAQAPRDAAIDARAIAVIPGDAAPADLVDASLPPGPIAGLVPLDPRGIPNNLENRVADMKAPPGEHLVAQDRLEAPTPEQAVADVDKEVATNPDRLNRLGQAMVYIAAGKSDGIAKLDKLLADHPDYARAWAAKGYIEVRAGRPREAEAAMTKALELDPTDAETLRNRGILRDHEGRARDAYPDLAEALRRSPNDVEAMAELAQVYSVSGHRDDARPLLERIVMNSPDNVTGWLDLSMVQPPSDALGSIRHALALDPRSQRGHVRLCTVSSELGGKDALAACDDAVKLAPADPWAWMGRGLTRYQIANDRKGLDDVDHAIAMDPQNGQFYINRYIVRSHAGMLAEAKADLQQACKLGKSEACNKLK